METGEWNLLGEWNLVGEWNQMGEWILVGEWNLVGEMESGGGMESVFTSNQSCYAGGVQISSNRQAVYHRAVMVENYLCKYS